MDLSNVSNIRFNNEDVKLIKIDGSIVYNHGPGKNLFDTEAFIIAWKSVWDSYVNKVIVDGEEILTIRDGDAIWKKEKGFKIPVKQGEKYVFSCDCRSIDGTYTQGLFCLRTGGTPKYLKCQHDTWQRKSIVITAEEDAIYVCSGYNNNKDFYVKNIQLELGDVATEYEPYRKVY